MEVAQRCLDNGGLTVLGSQDSSQSYYMCYKHVHLDAMALNSFGALPTWQESHWFL